MVAVEERAIRRHVVEHAVEDDLHAARARPVDEVLEVLHRPEVRIDRAVVGGVVAVVRLRREDRVEVDRRDAEALQVVELARDAREVAAHVVAAARALDRRAPRRRVAVEAPRAVRRRVGVAAAVALGLRVPRQLQDRVVVAHVAGLRVVLRVPVAEAVGEDLVDDRAPRPCRRRERRVVHGERVAVVDRATTRTARASVERGRIVGVVGGARPVADDEAVPEEVRTRARDGRLPEVARARGQARLVARHVGRGERHRDDRLHLRVDVPDAHLHRRDVVVERPEANLHGGARRRRAAGRAVDVGARVVPQSVPLDVVVVRARRRLDAHARNVRRAVVRDRDRGAWCADREGDVRAAGHAAGAVVDVPRLVERHLELVRAGRDRRRRERVRAVAVGILEPRAQTARIPVARAAELRLEAPRCYGDHGVVVVRDPVRLVVVVELDARRGAE